jgi:hypothetical protein
MQLLNMPPRSTKHDMGYVREVDSEQTRDASVRHSFYCAEAANFPHFSLGEFYLPLPLPACASFGVRVNSIPLAACRSALSRAIGVVLSIGPKKKMCGINAQPLIAAVTDTKPGIDRPKMDHPAYAVSQIISVLNAECPVSTPVFVTRPEPAFAWSSFLYISPKAALDLGRDLWQLAASQFRTHPTLLVRALWSCQRLLRPLLFTGLTPKGKR